MSRLTPPHPGLPPPGLVAVVGQGLSVVGVAW